MPSLQKVEKRVNKKKGGTKKNALHENSRDAMRLRRAAARDDKVKRVYAVREKANDKLLNRIVFLQDQTPESGITFTASELKGLIEEYLDRDTEELEQLKEERRPGRPKIGRQVVLEQIQEAEGKEYEAGFWVPDLREEGVVEALAKWTGAWSGLSLFKFVRINKEGNVKESAFPPTGAA